MTLVECDLYKSFGPTSYSQQGEVKRPVQFKGYKSPLGNLFQCLITPIFMLVKIQLSLMYSSNGSVLLHVTCRQYYLRHTSSDFQSSNSKSHIFSNKGAEPRICMYLITHAMLFLVILLSPWKYL